MAIDLASDVAAIFTAGDLPTVSGTFAAGSSTKSLTGIRPGLSRAGPTGEVELDQGVLIFKASDFSTATGWSGGVAVYPGRGHTFTVSGESVWTVTEANLRGGSSYYAVRFSRRRAAGAA